MTSRYPFMNITNYDYELPNKYNFSYPILKHSRLSAIHVMKFRRLKNLVSIIRRNPKVYWPAIFRHLHQNKKLISYESFLRKYPQLLLLKLLKFHCSDLNLARRILKLYGLSLCWPKNTLPLDCRKVCCEMPAVLEQVCSPLDSHELEDVKHFSDVEMVEMALQFSDVKLMTALLKYGLSNIPREVSQSEFPGAKGFMQVLGYDHGVLFGDTFMLYYCLEHIRKRQSDVRIFRRGARRFHLILRIIKILAYRENNFNSMYSDQFHNPENNIQCLKLYLRAIVEPLVSRDEIIDFFYTWYPNMPEHFVQGMAMDYEVLFREVCESNYTPRKLKHLCRHRVRSYVAEKKLGVLPEFVKSLRLPQSIASYLLCKSFNSELFSL